jgi:hypothetical protein
MNKKFEGILFTLLLILGCINGYSGEAKGWGTAINGVQLSVNYTNNFIEVGSTTNISVCVTNSSANSVMVFPGNNGGTFKVYITDRSGNTYKISPEMSDPGIVLAVFPPIFIDPRQSHKWMVSVTVGKDIKPGNYMLKATQSIYVGRKSFDITSNMLPVYIKSD